MITSVDIRDDLGAILGRLPLYSADLTSSFVIKKIDGIGPPAAEQSISTYAGYDGGILTANRTSVRSITLTIGYRPDWNSDQSVESLRGDLYRYFPPKDTLNLRFNNSNSLLSRWIEGVVESHEPNIFSKDPEVVISVVCPDPDFKPLGTQEFSSFVNNKTAITYYGTAATGFLLEVFLTRPFDRIFIKNYLDPDILIDGPFLEGDTIRVSTVRGNKFVRLIRNGSETNELERLTSGLLSMTLSRKTTNFGVSASGLPDVPYTVKYTPRYIGV